MVPSMEFEQRTADQLDRHAINVQADLLAERDAWRDCRRPLRAQADVIIAALHQQR